jgi:hypothetical protein
MAGKIRKQNRSGLWIAVVSIWALSLIAAFTGMTRYALTPGAAVAAPPQWPADLPFSPARHGFTFVLAMHPQCPCSRATVNNLATLIDSHPNQATCYVLMVRPAGEPANWEHTSLWNSAAAIPGTTVMTDIAGKWSARLGALTSGEVYAFDPAGRLLFSGGITDSRGHEGYSAGSAALAAILEGGQPRQIHTPVYGCALGVAPPATQEGKAK